TAAENVRLSVLRSHYRYLAVKAAREGSAHTLARLLGITPHEWNGAKDFQLNYAMAWSLTNYLLSTERGRGNFNMILAAVYRGKPLEKLLTPQVRKQLEQMWHEDMKTRMALYDDRVAPAWREAGRKRFDLSLRFAEAGVREHPKLSDARFWRGRVLLAAGRHEDALKDLAFAEKADREFPRIQAELGRACLETGDRTKAESWLRKAVKRNPADLASAALLEELQGGR
ncbi:MAG: tetratricopeptide repeat protein, partial [Planctomycetota bacterium]